eukprot:m.15865 g.15865  ORF g.15865 m.15865 type:complete len:276 (-) comp5514_c0_seq1:88-915(-)
MCIIQGKVRQVSQTNILVAPMKEDLQLTVYSNNVKLEDTAGAMLLPFPCADPSQENICKFLNLTNYKNIFKELRNACFPPLRKRMKTKAPAKKCSAKLKVVQVGSYKASIVPSVDDFERLRTDVFTVDPTVFKFLSAKYPSKYGFVVCQLDQDRDYHPFGYVSAKLEDGRMFIPTMHYHEHDEGYGDDDTDDDDTDDDPASHADWDHEIYTVNHPLDITPSTKAKMCSRTGKAESGDCLNNRKLPNMEKEVVIYGYRIGPGYEQNHDLFCKAKSS